ncbi:hypothetical protein OROGR_020796 [Orobanche gracilis]
MSYDSVSSNTLPLNKGNSTGAPPPTVLEPEDTPVNTSQSPFPSNSPPPPPSPSSAPLSGNDAARSNTIINGLLMVVVSICSYHFLILSS